MPSEKKAARLAITVTLKIETVVEVLGEASCKLVGYMDECRIHKLRQWPIYYHFMMWTMIGDLSSQSFSRTTGRTSLNSTTKGFGPLTETLKGEI